MDRDNRRAVEEYRRTEAGPIENNLIDELVNGELDRQDFLRRAAVFGLGAGTIGVLLRYMGEAEPAFGAAMAPGKVGGTIRVGVPTFSAGLEPYQLREAGSIGLAGIPGEYLTFSDQNLQVKPWLATSWKPNADLTVWTFQLRKGVKFHNGKTMTADDVVASFKSNLGEKSSQILGALPSNLIGPEGVVKTGPYTVQFRLKSPNNALPYLVSQTTYQGIIMPAAIASKLGSWVGSGMIGTGAFRLKSYVPKRSAQLVRFDGYWGGKPPLDGVAITYYDSAAPIVLALRAGQLDLAQQLSPQQVRPFQSSSKFKIFSAPTSAHRMFELHVDKDPFRDARVRRAVALTLNRPDVIQRVLLSAGTIGNDSPFWSKFPSTDPSIKQRKQDIELAKALLKAAGKENLKFTLTTHNQFDVPDYATAIQAAGRQAGMDITLEIMTYDDYYAGTGSDYYGTVPWFTRPATITEYGARGVPNLYVTAAYVSGGIWNATNYRNSQFDAAAKTFLGAADVQSQRVATKKMAGFLLRDTPVVTSYFITYITAGSSKVQNYEAEAISHLRLAKTSLA
jgi:peptide/nickel transport system substrate-binding protein